MDFLSENKTLTFCLCAVWISCIHFSSAHQTSKAAINQDKSPVTLAWSLRALFVYLWASSPAEKGKWGCGGRMEAKLVEQKQDHQLEVGWGFGVQRHPPVVREYMRAPILLDCSSVSEPIGYHLTTI